MVVRWTMRPRSMRRRCWPKKPASTPLRRSRGSRKPRKPSSRLFQVGHAAGVGKAHATLRAVRAEVDARRSRHRLLLEQLAGICARIAADVGIDVERAVRLGRDGEAGTLERRHEEIPPTSEFASSVFKNFEGFR